MNILLIEEKATPQEVAHMMQTLETYIKVAVDVKKGVLAGGGIMHADCEAVLLENGSHQEDVWGADYDPVSKAVTYEALINIRPRHGNRKMIIENVDICSKVEKIIRDLLER